MVDDPSAAQTEPSKLKLLLSEAEKPGAFASFAAQRARIIFDAPMIEDVMERPEPRIEPEKTFAFGGGTPFTIPAYRVSPSSQLSNRAFLGVPAAPPFKIEPTQFLKNARSRAPSEPEATASGFANWVYSLYGRPGSSEDIERGAAAEATIFGERPKQLGARSILTACDARFLARHRPEWELIHCGMTLDADVQSRPYYELPGLAVTGQSLGASPDLVYRNRATGEVIIVEVKLSRQSLPNNLWPNVWAQLWCYAQLPVALNASRLTVVGEIWGELYRWNRGRGVSEQWLGMRAAVRRDPRTPAFDRFFRTLFDIYRGHDD